MNALSKLKIKVLEFVNIAKECPENLQVVCFELLLKQYLESLAPKVQIMPDSTSAFDATGLVASSPPSEEKSHRIVDADKRQDDELESILHGKARRFVKKYEITMEELNNLFYLEDGKIAPLYENLETIKMAEGQIKIALLQALKNGLDTGNFETSVEEIRSEAIARKYYDQKNFAVNFKNKASFFDFGKHEKSITKVKLSEAGRKKLAEVIRELQ